MIGIFYGSFLGELLFLGTGLLITTGSPNQEYIGIADEQGQGGVQYNGTSSRRLFCCLFSSSFARPPLTRETIASLSFASLARD